MLRPDKDHHDVHHITPFATYIKVYLALVVLTVATVWLANLKVPATVAMVIATTKAFLVAWFFMHQKYEGKLNRIIFLSGFAFLLIFWGFTFSDWATRKTFDDIKFPKHKIEEAGKQ